MIAKKDIEKLAELARIGLNESEKDKLEKDVNSILDYVGQINTAKVDMSAVSRVGSVKNVMREDVVLNETGENKEVLLNEAPKRECDYVSVKKILGSADNEA